MRGRKRNHVPACQLFSGFDDDDEMEEDVNIDEDGDDEDGDDILIFPICSGMQLMLDLF